MKNKTIGDQQIVSLEMKDFLDVSKDTSAMDVHSANASNIKKALNLVIKQSKDLKKYKGIIVSISATKSMEIKDVKETVESITTNCDREAKIMWSAYIDKSFEKKQCQIFLFGFY